MVKTLQTLLHLLLRKLQLPQVGLTVLNQLLLMLSVANENGQFASSTGAVNSSEAEEGSKNATSANSAASSFANGAKANASC
ncbi:hypothetical protein ACYATO_00065 [Lactobacillaceae bacterium Melli_B3]